MFILNQKICLQRFKNYNLCNARKNYVLCIQNEKKINQYSQKKKKI